VSTRIEVVSTKGIKFARIYRDGKKVCSTRAFDDWKKDGVKEAADCLSRNIENLRVQINSLEREQSVYSRTLRELHEADVVL
jgi:hypothetical protein